MKRINISMALWVILNRINGRPPRELHDDDVIVAYPLFVGGVSKGGVCYRAPASVRREANNARSAG